jgi:hypothetical protein
VLARSGTELDEKTVVGKLLFLTLDEAVGSKKEEDFLVGVDATDVFDPEAVADDLRCGCANERAAWYNAAVAAAVANASSSFTVITDSGTV